MALDSGGKWFLGDEEITIGSDHFGKIEFEFLAFDERSSVHWSFLGQVMEMETDTATVSDYTNVECKWL